MLIQTAREAETFLLNCWRDPSYGHDESVAFGGCALKIKLDPGKGEANYKTWRAIRLLQRHINLTYTLAKRGDLTGRLTETERERLSITTAIRPGSTNISLDISSAIKTIHDILPDHWSRRARSMVVVGIALSVLAMPYGAFYAYYRTETDKAQIAAGATVKIAETTNRTNLDIARVQADAQVKVTTARGQPSLALADAAPIPEGALVLASLAKDDPSNIVAFALSNYVSWRPALLTPAPYGGTLQWDESAPIPAPVARAIAGAERKAATAARRSAKQSEHPHLIETPWVTEVIRAHSAPGAMRLGLSDA